MLNSNAAAVVRDGGLLQLSLPIEASSKYYSYSSRCTSTDVPLRHAGSANQGDRARHDAE